MRIKPEVVAKGGIFSDLDSFQFGAVIRSESADRAYDSDRLDQTVCSAVNTHNLRRRRMEGAKLCKRPFSIVWVGGAIISRVKRQEAGRNSVIVP